MEDFISILITILGFISFIGGLIAYINLTPKLLTPKNQWITKSIISSFAMIFGFFILVISWDIKTLSFALERGTILQSVMSILVFIIPGGILLVIGTYAKVFIGKKRKELMQTLIADLNEKKK